MGVAIGSIPSIILLIRRSHNGPNPPSPPTPLIWNASDYQSNSDYYNQLTTISNFNQTHNLRLDRLSSPSFNPNDGKSVIYLRKQYHMPDLNGSTTTLHWIDLETNKTIQLTRPIWGRNDQQVRSFFHRKYSNIFLYSLSFIGSIVKQFFFFLIVDHHLV